jgi:glycosyltransferase involved in cell wall biosynthesis
MATHARSYHQPIPNEILALSHQRDLLRRRGQYDRADLLKRQLEDAGYRVKDNPRGAHLVILPSIEVDGKLYRTARQLPSYLNDADLCDFSVNILAQNNIEDVRRCITSVLRFADHINVEIILVDNASHETLDLRVESLKNLDKRIHFVSISRPVGTAEARNIGLKQSRGRYILLLDANMELTGDIFTALTETLAQEQVGLTGIRGLRTDDLRHFVECRETEVEAIDGICMAFKRSLLTQCGLFDEGYRFPAYMDIDFSFAIRNTGAETILTPRLPIVSHPEPFSTTDNHEQARQTKRNFYRFLEKWGNREDLLLYAEEDEKYEEENEGED